MRVQCVLPSGITKVGETQTVDVINCNGNHCFQEDIGYEATMPQIIALLESSSSCSQTIDFQCFSAPLKVMINIQLGQNFQLWVAGLPVLEVTCSFFVIDTPFCVLSFFSSILCWPHWSCEFRYCHLSCQHCRSCVSGRPSLSCKLQSYSMFPIKRTVFLTSLTVHKNTVHLIANIE